MPVRLKFAAHATRELALKFSALLLHFLHCPCPWPALPPTTAHRTTPTGHDSTLTTRNGGPYRERKRALVFACQRVISTRAIIVLPVILFFSPQLRLQLPLPLPGSICFARNSATITWPWLGSRQEPSASNAWRTKLVSQKFICRKLKLTKNDLKNNISANYILK